MDDITQKTWNELKTICEKTPIVLSYLTNILPSSIFDVLDEEGNNLFLLACGYNELAVRYLLESENCTQSVVEHKNLDGYTALDIASKTSVSIVKVLLDSDKCTKDFVMSHEFNSNIFMMNLECVHSLAYIKKSRKYLDLDTFEFLENDEIENAKDYKKSKSLIGWFSK